MKSLVFVVVLVSLFANGCTKLGACVKPKTAGYGEEVCLEQTKEQCVTPVLEGVPANTFFSDNCEAQGFKRQCHNYLWCR